MYTTLLTKIETTLNTVNRVQENFSYPKTKITKYPAVFYFPDGFENSYETNSENFKIYKFKMFVIIGVKQTTIASASDVMAKTVQDIMAAFDEQWNMGVIDGHRAWVTLGSGDPWQLSGEQDGMELSAALNLEVRLLTNN